MEEAYPVVDLQWALTPFVLGSTNWDDDPENFNGYNTNGYLLGFNFPLDGSLVGFVGARLR